MRALEKKRYAAILLASVLILTLPFSAMPQDEEADYLQSGHRFADEADEITPDWTYRTDSASELSGVLYDSGDEEGGRVCYPDCPSGWDQDEYDLWELDHSGEVVHYSLNDVGIDDGTTTINEWCVGQLGDMWCDEIEYNGNHETILFPKPNMKTFIRISPESSWGDDDVDYTIRIEEEYPDDRGGARDPIVLGKSRHIAIEDGYVCYSQCHEDDDEWEEFGQDAFDAYSIHLYAFEQFEFNIHTYPTPNQGRIQVWLLEQDMPLNLVEFANEEEWTVHLYPTASKTYTLLIGSGPSEDWDGMTYDITGTLWWSSITRDPDADFDGDGWTDRDEYEKCGSNYLLASSVPQDYDGDGYCDSEDWDDDGDGVDDDADRCARGMKSGSDYDGDGCKDAEDSDDDDDGVPDGDDAFPKNADEWSDYNSDGVGDNEDPPPSQLSKVLTNLPKFVAIVVSFVILVLYAKVVHSRLE